MAKVTQVKKAAPKKTVTKKIEVLPKKDKDLNRQKVEDDSDSESEQEESEEEVVEVTNEQDEDDAIDGDNEAEDEDIDAKKEEDEEGDDYEEEDNCIYDINDDEDEENIDEFNVEEEFDTTSDNVFVAPEDRRTPAVLFSFERTRIIGDRSQQINLGAKRGIKNSEHLAPHEVAELELQHNMIPLLIVRPLENGKKELWKISELAH